MKFKKGQRIKVPRLERENSGLKFTFCFFVAYSEDNEGCYIDLKFIEQQKNKSIEGYYIPYKDIKPYYKMRLIK